VVAMAMDASEAERWPGRNDVVWNNKTISMRNGGDALRYAAARIHSPPKMPAGTGAVAFRSVFAFVVLQTCNKPHSAIARTAGFKYRA